MTIEFNCKFCGKILRTGDDKAGRQAKCPSCGETIAVPAETGAEEHFETFDDPPAAVPPSAAAPRAASSARRRSKAQDFVDDVDPYDDEDYDDDHDDDPYDDDDDPAPRRRASQRMKNCPVCGAQVKAKALKCRHCGEELDDDLPPRPSGRNRGRSGARRSGPQEVYAGEIISDAWQIYTENMGIVIGCHVITSIMIVVLYVVAYLGMALVGLAGFAAIGPGRGGGAAAGVGVVAILALFVFACVLFIGFSFFHVGLKLSVYNIVRGKGGEISDLFQGGPYLLRFIGASLLFGLAYGIGGVLCVVPGILVLLMLWPYLYALFDRDGGALDCLTDAKAATDGNWGAAFVLFLFVLGINLAGALACGVGQIFTIPLSGVVWAVAYCRMAGLDVDV